MRFGISTRGLPTAALCAAVFLLQAACGDAATREEQRELFREAHAGAERGEWSLVAGLADEDRRALEEYPLWPDLRAAYLRANLEQVERNEIEDFLERYDELRPARELRYRYALELARRDAHDAYLELYTEWYGGLGIPKLDCLALAAEIETGDAGTIARRGRELWLVGESQVDECDPVFEYMKDHEVLRPEDYRARFALALEAHEFRLARWLGRSIDEAHVRRAQRWLDVQANPAAFLQRHATHDDSAETRAQLAYAAERVTYSDPQLARELWQREASRHAFESARAQAVARHIALWAARDNLPGARAELGALDPATADDEVWRWRARTSMRAADWEALLEAVDGMSATEKDAEEWRFWRALALRELGDREAAQALLEALAGERSYYGFLAADELGREYSFGHSALSADAAVIARLGRREDIDRALELFHVGLEGRGRSEWDAAMSSLTPEEKNQAALLAHERGWHSRAIATLSDTATYDDLLVRYPLVYRGPFEQYAADVRIPVQWALGIARSESLFMRDIRSPAGAVGVMQLLPSTGRGVARDLALPWQGVATLTDPESNIRLGTAYLASMAERYAGNRVLATAAYNAGPRRVDDWVPANAREDARVWIENIPYNETRSYVRRVLAAEIIFHWRLTGRSERLSDSLAAVGPAVDAERVASLSR